MGFPRAPLPVVPPIWRESRYGMEYAGLRRSDVLRGEGVPAGDGRGALLVPGFLAGDGSLATMAGWLRAAGWRPKRAGIRMNVGCSESLCTRLEERLEGLAEETGERVMVIGQSRGGVFAKALGARRPDLVAGVITLGSPVRSQLSVHPLVLAQIAMVGALGTASAPGFFSLRCLRGDCCSRFRDALVDPFPPEVGYVSIYSRSDGIVDWRSCLDDDAECVEIRASHCGMSVSADAYRAIAAALAGFGAREASWPQTA